jgi:hypothetical protein
MKTAILYSFLLLFLSCTWQNYPPFSPGSSREPDYADLRNWVILIKKALLIYCPGFIKWNM